MVGDGTTNDIAGAQRAGMRTIWYNPTKRRFPDGAQPPDAVIKKLSDLPATVDRLAGVRAGEAVAQAAQGRRRGRRGCGGGGGRPRPARGGGGRGLGRVRGRRDPRGSARGARGRGRRARRPPETDAVAQAPDQATEAGELAGAPAERSDGR